MKFLLLVHFKNETASYYGDDPDILIEYAEIRGFKCWEVYELSKIIHSYCEKDSDLSKIEKTQTTILKK